jgi:hypothetical protein
MAVTYCTSKMVFEYLQRTDTVATVKQTDFGTGTTPTKLTVEDYINRAESEINRHTGTAWMPITVTNEIHRMDFRPSRNVKQWRPQVILDYRPIRTLTVSTDKIEVYNGSSWAEWVATKTEGRNADYWVDYANGIIFFEKGYPIYPFNEGVRLTYRYGYSTVAGWVQELATMMAALRVIEFDRTRMVAAGGSGGNPDKPTTDGAISNLKSQIKDKLDEAKWLTNQDRRPFMVV